MASPVKDAKNEIQSQWPGAIVHSRGKGWIKHQHPTNPNRFALDTQVGGLGWHFGDGPFDEDHEVDTAWQVGQGVWDYEVVKNDFHSFVNDSVPVTYRYLDAATQEEVQLTVTGVEWVNDENDSEDAAQFSQVTPTIDDDTLTWEDIATGWDVSVQAQTARLVKYLSVDTLASLGSPTIGGTNERLQLSFNLTKSSGLEIWLDGVQWDEKNNTQIETSGDIEFRDGSTGDPVFLFKRPSVKDQSKTQTGTITQRIKKLGGNLRVYVSVPWSWLQTATFPIVIDPTIDEQVTDTNSQGDGHETDNSNWNEDGLDSDGWAIGNSGGNDLDAGLIFEDVAIPKDATVSTAYNSFFAKWQYDNDVSVVWYGIDEDDAGLFATDGTNRPSTRTNTTASVAYTIVDADITDEDWYSLSGKADIKGIIEEIVARENWASGNNIGIIVENTDASSGHLEQFNDYTYSSTNAAKLHIDYTAGGAGASIALSTATIDTIVNNISIIPSAVSTTLDSLPLQSLLQDLNVSAGVATLNLDTLSLDIAPDNLSVVAGAATLGVDSLSLRGLLYNLSIESSASLGMDTLPLSVVTDDLSILAGDATLDLSSLLLRTIAGNLSILAGSATLNLDTLSLDINTDSLSVLIAESIDLKSLLLRGNAIDASVLADAATTELDSLLLQSVIDKLSIEASATMSMDTLSLNISTDNISILPGATTLSLDSILLRSYLRNTSILAGATSLDLVTLTLDIQAGNVVIATGVSTINLNTLSLDILIDEATIIAGAASTTLDALFLQSAVGNVTISTAEEVVKLPDEIKLMRTNQIPIHQLQL